MKIVSWNINGLRSMKKVHLKEIIERLSADIICLQETKLTRDQLEEDTAVIDGYNSYYSFSKRRSGYSGVAIICKNSCTPVAAEEGLTDILQNETRNDVVGSYGEYSSFSNQELQELDSEGRALLTQHEIRFPDGSVKKLTIINVYCPRAEMDNVERSHYKLKFYNLLQLRAESLMKDGSHVMILGDINVSHKPIDSAKFDDIGLQLFTANDGRKWLDEFLIEISSEGTLEKCSEKKFVDSFRYFHPTLVEAYTCWCTVTSCRQTNFGTRLDYIFADLDLLHNAFASSNIMPEVNGSDHCPVTAELTVEFIPSAKLPSLCTKNWPEFHGTQKKLGDFFSATNETKLTMHSSGTGELLMKRKSKEPLTKPMKRTKSIPQQKTLFSFVQKSSIKSNQETDVKEENPFLHDAAKICAEDIQMEEKQANAKVQLSESWKNLFKGPEKPPVCKGHDEPCVLRTVKKPGENCGRQFYVCARPDGHKSNPQARCDFFQWKTKIKKKT